MAEQSAKYELDARLLVVAQESGQTREFPMGLPTSAGSSIVIGRSRDADLTIHDDYVSNRHVRITFQDGQHWIEDLGSTHGTSLDGVKLTRSTALKTGATIELGQSTCQYRCVEREVSKVSLSSLQESDPAAEDSDADASSPPAPSTPTVSPSSSVDASASLDHSVSIGSVVADEAENAQPAKKKSRRGRPLRDYFYAVLSIAAVVLLVGYLGWQVLIEYAS